MSNVQDPGAHFPHNTATTLLQKRKSTNGKLIKNDRFHPEFSTLHQGPEIYDLVPCRSLPAKGACHKLL